MKKRNIKQIPAKYVTFAKALAKFKYAIEDPYDVIGEAKRIWDGIPDADPKLLAMLNTVDDLLGKIEWKVIDAIKYTKRAD